MLPTPKSERGESSCPSCDAMSSFEVLSEDDLLVVASLLAAFMSTIDTHLNWGASYVANDMLPHWIELKPERIALVSRLSVVLIATLAVGVSFMMDSITGAWEFMLALGALRAP